MWLWQTAGKMSRKSCAMSGKTRAIMIHGEKSTGLQKNFHSISLSLSLSLSSLSSLCLSAVDEDPTKNYVRKIS